MIFHDGGYFPDQCSGSRWAPSFLVPCSWPSPCVPASPPVFGSAPDTKDTQASLPAQWVLRQEVKVLKVVCVKTVRSPSSFLRADGPLPGYHHLLTSYQSDRMVQYKGASGVTVPGHSAVQENPMCRLHDRQPGP